MELLNTKKTKEFYNKIDVILVNTENDLLTNLYEAKALCRQTKGLISAAIWFTLDGIQRKIEETNGIY